MVYPPERGPGWLCAESAASDAMAKRSVRAGAVATAVKGARKGGGAAAARPMKERIADTLAWLEEHGTPHDRANMAKFGIVGESAGPGGGPKKYYGVSMANLKALAKRLGRDHDLALALWETGWYEARMLASLVDQPERVTVAQMDRWVKDFDNWGICDTVCFCLFDRSPHAHGRVERWCGKRNEFEKRAGFALLACLALHDKTSGDEPFVRGLLLVEQGAGDDRNFVKKGVSWALRAIGLRNAALRKAAVEVAGRLAVASESAGGARWVGKDALRALKKK